MPTFEYVFCNENRECAIWKPLIKFIGDSPPRAWYCNIVTASVFCRSEVSSRTFHLQWIFKTADPFFSKFGTIVDQSRAQKTVKRHFWKIICGDFYSKKIFKSGKFVPYFDRLRIYFYFFTNLYRSRIMKKPIISIKIFTEQILFKYFLFKENCLWVGSICKWAKYL